IVMDPILAGCEKLGQDLLGEVEQTGYLMECQMGLREPNPVHPEAEAREYVDLHTMVPGLAGVDPATYKWVPSNKLSFDKKKAITSAIRRFAVNGQVNEILWSVNLRALRHMLQMRTNRHAEYEIRLVFGQVYDIVRERFPIALSDAKVALFNDLPEVTGLRTQPYAPQPIDELNDDVLVQELLRRGTWTSQPGGTLARQTQKAAAH